MQILIFCEFGLKTPMHTPKIEVFLGGGQNSGRDGAMLTSTNSFLLLEVITSVPVLVNIDQEMRS